MERPSDHQILEKMWDTSPESALTEYNSFVRNELFKLRKNRERRSEEISNSLFLACLGIFMSVTLIYHSGMNKATEHLQDYIIPCLLASGSLLLLVYGGREAVLNVEDKRTAKKIQQQAEYEERRIMGLDSHLNPDSK